MHCKTNWILYLWSNSVFTLLYVILLIGCQLRAIASHENNAILVHLPPFINTPPIKHLRHVLANQYSGYLYELFICFIVVLSPVSRHISPVDGGAAWNNNQNIILFLTNNWPILGAGFCRAAAVAVPDSRLFIVHNTMLSVFQPRIIALYKYGTGYELIRSLRSCYIQKILVWLATYS